MMKIRYSPSPDLSFEVDAGTMKEAFKAIFDLSEVFGERKCGCCGSDDVRFFVREDKEGHHYYKMACKACPATFDYGQFKEGGGLFAKKWDKENRRPYDNGGWSVYRKDGDGGETPSRQPSTPVKPLSGGPELKNYRKRWDDFLGQPHTLDEFNAFVRDQLPLCPVEEKKALWERCLMFETTWSFDRDAREFVANVGTESPF